MESRRFGETVEFYTPSEPGGVEVSVMTYGAAVQRLLVLARASAVTEMLPEHELAFGTSACKTISRASACRRHDRLIKWVFVDECSCKTDEAIDPANRRCNAFTTYSGKQKLARVKLSPYLTVPRRWQAFESE